MGRLGTLIDVTDETIEDDEQTEARVEMGGDDPVTAPVYSPAGIVSKPVPGDLVALLRLDGKGEFAVVGFSDPVNAQSLELGEVIVLARSSNGVPVSAITLSGDGRILLQNDNGQMELKANGQVDINGHLTVDP